MDTQAQPLTADVIDLRPYLLDLLSYWKFVIGIPFITGLVSISYFLFLDAQQYEATALVAITESSFAIAVTSEAQIETNDDLTSASDAYPELALSDGLIEKLYNDSQLIALWPAEIDNVRTLKSRLNSTTGSDENLIRLNATFADADLPDVVVNRWASLFIDQLNDVYGTSTQSLAILEAELAEADKERLELTNALVEFEGQNRQTILESQLTSLTMAQTIAQDDRLGLSRIRVDLQSLQQQLALAENPTLDPTTLFLLQLRLYGTTDANVQIDNISFDINDMLSGSAAVEQVNGMLLFVETKQTVLDDELASLEPQILSIQSELESAIRGSDHLQNSVNLASDTYAALAIKVEEERVTDSVFAGQVRLASPATQVTPVGGGGLTTTAVLVIVMGLATVASIILRRWWVDLFVE